VTIAILSVILGITTLSLAGEKHPATTAPSLSVQVRILRSSAIASGIPKTATLKDTSGAVLVTALPDGRVVSDMPNLDRNAGILRSGSAR